MSGPCADCGGPDYQTLVARIMGLEAMNEGLAGEVKMYGAANGELKDTLSEAEAALAERDELRCTSCDDEAECSILTAVCEHSDWEIEDGYQFGCRLHTDIRARAERSTS